MAKSKSKVTSKAASSKKTSQMSKPPAKRRKLVAQESENEESSDDIASEGYKDDDSSANVDSEPESLNSDFLDDEVASSSKKRRKGVSRPSPKTQSSSTLQRRKTKTTPKVKKSSNISDEDALSEVSVEEGQEIVGRIVQAPKTGHVPSGRISQNTFNFLTKLANPEYNDREWFKLHEPVYRLAEKEWVAFVDTLVPKMTEVDDQLPHLPAKDVIHRIYRDIRFSNDKTPYKRNFSASISRSGRKGIFAGYHVSICPGNKSFIGAGAWCPGKNELATIRSNILRNSSRLRNVISSKEFVKLFGQPKPHPEGERRNVFGFEDMLKVAPKGVDKNHKDIDLLKLRSICVGTNMLDSEVLDPKFVDNLCNLFRVMQPFVHCLNDMMTVAPESESGDDDNED